MQTSNPLGASRLAGWLRRPPRTMRGMARAALLYLTAGGCGTGGLVLTGAPPRAFDAVVLPGCPVAPDGTLSGCLVSRVLWGAVLWERGWTERFIVSGAAVHSPWVEAEALAAGLAALGVPPDRIWLEPHALHTDENMYNSSLIARALGLQTLAVASNGSHALWACRMMRDVGASCRALPVDAAAIRTRHAAAGDLFGRLRIPAVPDGTWVPLPQREAQRARRLGRAPRPASFLLYATYWLMYSNGERWTPFPPPNEPPQTWAQRLAALKQDGRDVTLRP